MDTIKCVSFIKSKRKIEKSGSVSSSTTKTTTSSYSTGHLVLESVEDDGEECWDKDSRVPRPVNHIGNNCFCFENREDCTTCSTLYTEDSEIFLLTSSESRSLAGSSSEDGSSMESIEPSESLDDTSGFSLISVSVEEDPTSETLDDRIIDLQCMISNQKSRIRSEKDSFDEPISFDETDMSRLILENCHSEHSEIRNEYLKRLMDEDIMKSNMFRIEELQKKLRELRMHSEEEEDLEKILDDVSTCQSFCPDDL
uniref:Suppressor protein SRP40-like n=1 Tax=Caenorhabditis tropicalis TaxID=1561998 RepID=A0A1I7UFS0_9PELO